MIVKTTLHLVHYCYPDCEPLQNIMRLPRAEAFALAKKLAAQFPEKTAFGRFADFEKCYPRRMAADRTLLQSFLAQGGKPKETHPLFFVLHGSDYLFDWFGQGKVIRIPLESVPSEAVSFTYGDSCAEFCKTGKISVFSKEKLLADLAESGGIAPFMEKIAPRYTYIEAQIWDDAFCRTEK